MRPSCILQVILLWALFGYEQVYAQTPPYGGTIFIEPNIITSADPSTLQSVTYTGQGMKTVFDRRVNNWININAHLFAVVWNDGLISEAVINPEFTLAEATTEANKYGFLIGQLPYVLRTDVNEIWIHKGVQPFGGGNYSILIHTGQSALYENDGIIEETLIHEASHTSLDLYHATTSGWLSAQNLDNQFISTYAMNYPNSEDIAESFLTWLAVRYKSSVISAANYDIITTNIPNRLSYFDSQNFNMSPVANCPAPPLIIGLLNSCTNSTQNYSVLPTAGSTYVWTVTGGNILSGQNTHQITVQWLGTTAGTVSVMQTTP